MPSVYNCSNFFTPDVSSHMYTKAAMIANNDVKSHINAVMEMAVLNRNTYTIAKLIIKTMAPNMVIIADRPCLTT